MKLNFQHRFAELVASGKKRQTIRPWLQPSVQKLKVGDKLHCWESKRGLKTGEYCEECLDALEKHYLLTGVHGHDFLTCTPLALPRKLFAGVCVEKTPIKLFMTHAPFSFQITHPKVSGSLRYPFDLQEIAVLDGFNSAIEMCFWFEKCYKISKKPVAFGLIRW